MFSGVQIKLSLTVLQIVNLHLDITKPWTIVLVTQEESSFHIVIIELKTWVTAFLLAYVVVAVFCLPIDSSFS